MPKSVGEVLDCGINFGISASGESELSDIEYNINNTAFSTISVGSLDLKRCQTNHFAKDYQSFIF